MPKTETKKTKDIKDLLNEVLEKQKLSEYVDFYSYHADKYSFSNALKIFMQFPDATFVAGKKQWREKGRIVKDGEKPITIYAPQFVWEEFEGKKRKILKDWTLIEVYDITQTDFFSTDYDNTSLNIGAFNLNDPTFLFNTYVEKLKNKVVVLENEEFDTKFGVDTNGYVNYKTGTIYIRNLEPIQKIRLLFHELAHYQMWHNKLSISQSQKEIEAELASYIVCKYLDLDTKKVSVEYIAAWINAGDNKTLKYNVQRLEKFVKFFSSL